jgi:4-amino-4-deoxy-L-arabinose transferase-like glycosyltransferase
LGLLFWKRHPEDRFILAWFFATYVFFTFIGQVQWRYIVPIFPAIAISASRLITFVLTKLKTHRKSQQTNFKRKHLAKFAAAGLIALTIFGVTYSCLDAVNWTKTQSVWDPPVEQTTNYITAKIGNNESVVVLCPVNVVNSDTVKFYIYTTTSSNKQQPLVWQYPNVAVDVNTANFNITELIDACKENNAKYLLLYEYGETFPYYNTTLTMNEVNTLLLDTQNFTMQTIFGIYPQKIFVYTFSTN